MIDQWMSGNAARKRLECGYGTIQRLAVLGKVRTLIEPGVPIRYNRADVEAVAGNRSGEAALETSPR